MTLIFSIHYFLWYGALTSIFGYEGVYARYYTNATPMQYGYLNLVLPFMTVIVTPVICSLADRKRLHRAYFTLSLMMTTIALCSYSMLPLISDRPPGLSHSSGLLLGPWIYYCLNSLFCDLSVGINTCLSDSFAVLQAEERGSSFGRIIVWGTFGWASSALILSLINQLTLVPRLVPGLLFGSLLLTLDVVVVSFWPQPSDFKLDIIPISAAQTLTGSASSAHRDPSDYQPLNESAKINFGNDFDGRSGEPKMMTRSPVNLAMINRDTRRRSTPKEADFLNDLDRSTLKTINSDYLTPEDDSSSFAPSPYDSKINESTQKNSIKLIQSSLSTNNESRRARSKDEPNRSTSAKLKTSFKTQLVLLGLIMRRRKSLIRYLIMFSLSGFFMSTHWNYFFLYLEKIYHDKFELISALSMVGQSVLGELPFFILSRKVIDYCGRSYTLSLSIISIGVRFLLYAYLLPNCNMYCIVLADCFQGPNYGLFYVIMTEVGLEYSFCDEDTIDRLAARGYLDRNNKFQVDAMRLSLRSTVQSVAFACYEGIGVGLGSLTGGWIVATFGFKTLWLSMALCSIFVGLLNILIEFSCRERDPEREENEQREFMYAKRTGALKKLASPVPLTGVEQGAQAPALKRLVPASVIQLMARKSASSRHSSSPQQPPAHYHTAVEENDSRSSQSTTSSGGPAKLSSSSAQHMVA